MRLNQTESKQQVSSKTATKNEKHKIDLPQAFHLQTTYKRHKCNLIFTFLDTLVLLTEYYLYAPSSYSTQSSRSEYNSALAEYNCEAI